MASHIVVAPIGVREPNGLMSNASVVSVFEKDSRAVQLTVDLIVNEKGQDKHPPDLCNLLLPRRMEAMSASIQRHMWTLLADLASERLESLIQKSRIWRLERRWAALRACPVKPV